MPSTLLLADDSVTIQRVIELTFADEDVRVVAVSDGAAAIDVLEKSLPDIVLADAEMPGRNGYEVARHIRETPRLAHIPIILLKGAFEPIDESRAASVGCDGVLEKPFEPQLVIMKVKELLSRAAARSPVPLSQENRISQDPNDQVQRDEMPNDQAAKGPDSVAAALEQWPEESAEPVGPPAVPAPESSDRPKGAEFDTYLDRIDAALDRMPPRGRGRSAEGKPVKERGMPAAGGGLPEPVERAAAEATVPASPVVSPVPAFPPLSEAFTALLAAEQGATEPPAAARWPVGPVRGFSSSPVAALPEDIVEEVTQRVLAHMSDRIVRETVTDLVARQAERLVREEIARLKEAVPKRGEEVKG